MSKPVRSSRWEEVSRLLHKQGLALTRHRKHVLRALASAERPVTIEELARLVEPRPHRVTLYRITESLAAAGLVKCVRFRSDAADRYELADPLQAHHHHLVCESCGQVEAVTGCEAVLPKLTAAKNFLVRGHQLEYYGFCVNCQEGAK